MREIKIAKNDAGQRLDKFLTKAVKGLLDKTDVDDEIIEKLVKAVKAKIDIDKAADLLGGLKKLF